ncbi:MAG: MBL fold metallo-hydrolase, partial [Proteobacteria bacterium]|nr:MBL fold metallo-hydrolase [Pseudomonadota bacterium]
MTRRLSRRNLLGSVGAVGLGAAIGALAPSRLWAATRTHQFKVGAADVTVVSDGVFTLPQRLVLPDTAPADAAALLKAGNGEIVAETNVTVVRLGDTTALIDTGAGPDFMPTLGQFPDALEGAGVAPDTVTHVIFTHAHADHFWGVVDPLGDGSRWTKARHVMTSLERDFWLSPGVEDKVPAFQKGMAVGTGRRMKSLAETIAVAKANDEIASGIAYRATPGHTPGHASVTVRSGSDELVVLGDALTNAIVSFEAPQWRWGSDVDGDIAIETRKRILDDLARRKVTIV